MTTPLRRVWLVNVGSLTVYLLHLIANYILFDSELFYLENNLVSEVTIFKHYLGLGTQDSSVIFNVCLRRVCLSVYLVSGTYFGSDRSFPQSVE